MMAYTWQAHAVKRLAPPPPPHRATLANPRAIVAGTRKKEEKRHFCPDVNILRTKISSNRLDLWNTSCVLRLIAAPWGALAAQRATWMWFINQNGGYGFEKKNNLGRKRRGLF